jgi:histidinol-phosphate aminotransferase
MKYWNSILKNMAEYIPGEQPEESDEFTKLNTNENPFPPPPSVLEAIKGACTERLRRYPDARAEELRKMFASQNSLTSENIFIGNGSDEIFTLIFRAFIERGGTVALPYPSYPLYDVLAEASGVKYEKINLEKDFSYNLKSFLKKKYDMVIICNPNNPTGTYCEVDEIREFLANYRGLLVVDEAYIDFYGGSAISLVNMFDNIIVTRSFSKSYSLAGLRIGLAAAEKSIIEGFLKIKDSYNVDILAIEGAKAALTDWRGIKYNLEMVRNNKEYLEEYLASMGFEIIPSRANFLFVRHPDAGSEEIYMKLKEKNILVRYFSGSIRSEYLRISIGTMMEIKKLCSELSAIVGA